jgi:hypothetical protein
MTTTIPRDASRKGAHARRARRGDEGVRRHEAIDDAKLVEPRYE